MIKGIELVEHKERLQFRIGRDKWARLDMFSGDGEITQKDYDRMLANLELQRDAFPLPVECANSCGS